MPDTQSFAARLVQWQRAHGRHGLPWQGRSGARPPAYHVWLSEVMLQQTQVVTVIAYFERFLKAFPTVHELAAAPLDDVLALWSGLGYYSRARNLHKAAQVVVSQHQGEFPRDQAALAELPGIGRSTAAAIAALAYGEKAAILDGNVKRVLSRIYAVEADSLSATDKILWGYAEESAPSQDIEAYTQGLMDLGATLCTRTKPRCSACPFENDCAAHLRGDETRFPVKQLKAKKPKEAGAEPAQTRTAAGAARRSRRAVLLLLEHEGQWLLERRPDSGIWGGLWSALEFESNEEALHAAASYGAVISHEAGLEVKHSFTHFDLYATPLYVCLQSQSMAASETSQRFCKRDEILKMGIPSLLRKLMVEL